MTQHISSQKWKRDKKCSSLRNVTVPAPSQIPFMSVARSQVLFMTSMCILAVDFPLFPRRFAKTKFSGFSLMDVGVAFFVMLAALVSPEAKQKHLHGSFGHVKQAAKSCAILIVIGLIRILTVKGIDYQSPVLEYGVHWNFFFTFACVKIISALLYVLFPATWDAAISVALFAVYELTLRFTSLNTFLHNNDRTGLIAANKEGLSSLIGYIALYLGTVVLGKQMVYKPRYQIREWVKSSLTCMLLSAVGFLFTYAMHTEISPVSRRLANASYCSWTFSIGTLILGLHIAFEVLRVLLENPAHVTVNTLEIRNKEDIPNPLLIWDAMNFNAMGLFLLSNLLTGLFNVVLQTRTAGSVTCLLILFLYLFILVIFSLYVYRKKIKVKFL
ncbi:phosphatidylinositol-glycan biosynthesis class W protein-like isoform X2 [Ornithodoros turicata]